MGKGGNLHKGFCSNTYRKCRHINQQIAHIVSKRIVVIAKQFNAEAIVFENLKGWKATGGRKRSAYTSKLAYDGSGVVRRDSTNYALANVITLT